LVERGQGASTSTYNVFYVDVESLLSLASLGGGVRCDRPWRPGARECIRREESKGEPGTMAGLREQRRVVFQLMLLLKAHVKNGRLVLDDPTTDLPEGAEVELVVVDDEFDPESPPARGHRGRRGR
jgi:hypothetical protein